MYGSISELMANAPDFNRMRIQGGSSPYSQPIMPGENREVMPASMQDKLQMSPPPVLKQARDFLDQYLTEQAAGEVAQVAPRGQRGFEADMGGMYGPGGVYIRGTIPEEQKYRDDYFEQRIDRTASPFRGV